MPILQFQKVGVVTVGTADPDQQVNLQDPIGHPVEINFNFVTESLLLTISASDGLNTVGRHYPIQMDEQAMNAIIGLFAQHVQRLARKQYSEFQDLQEVTQ